MDFKISYVFALALLLFGCQYSDKAQNLPNTNKATTTVSIPFEKYTLSNGLTVILHQDTSDPLVHVDVTYHVGSAREEPNKTGFAHFFEHMMFQGSQHVADEQHFKVVTNAGGSLNGSTNRDRTNYFQSVPSNQLEKILWLESDRMGFLLPAVTKEKFEIQRATVKNERAERVDNQPYGQRNERIDEVLYPYGHPYSWQTIGYVEDLDRVGVDDLKQFFKRWYGPNNAVLTIGGDIDIAQTKAWVDKYFGDIPAGPEVVKAKPTLVRLTEDRYITLEDNVHLPLLQITIPTVYAHHPDEPALDLLADVIGGGKNSLFYKNMVKDGIAVQASASHPCSELACEFSFMALASPDRDATLDDLKALIEQTLKQLESNPVDDDELAGTKAQIEASVIYGLQSVQGRVSTLAYNQTFLGTPDHVEQDIARYNKVTSADVMRVYEKYIKSGHGVYLSVVPKGQPELALSHETLPRPQRPDGDTASMTATLDPSPISTFDRSVIPSAGPAPIIKVPELWHTALDNGVPIIGTSNYESPTVSIIINMEGGMLLDPLAKAGLASMTSQLMNETTQSYSNEELDNALARLGSSISFNDSGRYIQISVSSLIKNLRPTMALLEEKLFHPAFIEDDFKRVKNQLLDNVLAQSKNLNVIADHARDHILFGDDNRISYPVEGTLATIKAMTLTDVKGFYQTYFSPAKASIVVVGALTQEQSLAALSFLNEWQGDDYTIPNYKAFPNYTQQQIFLVDNPQAVQSIVKIVNRSIPYDPTGLYFRAQLMNFPLGGAFNSRINLNLREEKGYTYGAFSSIQGGKTLGWFEAGGDFKQQNTAAAINEIFQEIKTYTKQGVTKDEVTFMRNAFTLSEALEYETPSSKASFLRHLQNYQLSPSFKEEQLTIINTIDPESINDIARKMLKPEQMQIIVVADKASVMPQLQALGLPITEISITP
jgi:zinc protease